MSQMYPTHRRDHVPGDVTEYARDGTEHRQRYCSCGHNLPWHAWEAEYEAHLVVDGAAQALREMIAILMNLRDRNRGSGDFGRGMSVGIDAALEAIDTARRRVEADQAA